MLKGADNYDNFFLKQTVPFFHNLTNLTLQNIVEINDAYKIIDTINNLSLPDFEDKHGNYMKGNSFHVKEATKDVHMYTDVDKNAFVFDNKKVTAVFKTKKFRYHVAPLMTAKGHAEVDMNQIEIRVGEQFSVHTLDDGVMVPHFKSVDIKNDINRHNIKLHIHGNLLTDIASIFEVFFKGAVCDAIEDAIHTALKDQVPAILNNVFDKSEGTVGIINMADWMLDF